MKRSTISGKMLLDFETALTEEEKSEATVEKYLRDVRHFLSFAGGTALSKQLVLSYKAHLQTHYSLTSANSMLSALNGFLRYLGWGELCVRRFKIQKCPYCPEARELSREEYLSLIRAAQRKGDLRLALVMQTICATGIRVSELEAVTVEAVKRGEAVVSCKGKTRRVFIVTALRKKLLHYAKQRGITAGMIFVTKSGKALDRSNIWMEMKKLCAQAGVSPSKVFPHNLRHLFARTFYAMEKDIAKLADILGHSSVDTTRIYIITTGAEHRRRVEDMNLIL